MKRLPIGQSDFKTIIEEDMYFVDKSLLIKEVIESGNVLLITRPRRFGKTLSQSMMKYFFDITQNNDYLFKNLKIYKEKNIIEKHLNKHPVIYITFKDLKSNNLKKMHDLLISELSTLYIDHKYVLDVLDNEEKIIYDKIMDREALDADYENSIRNLSKYMERYYGKKVIILIDECDIPIKQAYLYGYYDEITPLIGNLFSSALKDNVYLEKAVLTGITGVTKGSIFSGLNNIEVSIVLSNLLNDKYGFTKEEVEETLKYYELEYEEKEVIDWYNGYNFGGVEIYNPFSIINLVDEKKIGLYWMNTSGNYLIRKLIKEGSAELKDKIEKLINGEEIESKINETMVYGDLYLNSNESIWTLFLFSGYLKWIKETKEGYRRYTLAIPNKEVRMFYEDTVLLMLEEGNIQLDNILINLINGHIEEFKEDFQKLTMNTLSYFDVSGEEPERFYHGLILGMSVGLKEKYIIKSNRETGLGRADVVLIPKDKTDKGIIIEFKKFYKNEKTLLNSAQNGLKQINEKKYEEEIKSYGINDIIKVSIAFDKKEVEIVSNLDKEENNERKDLEYELKLKSIETAKKLKEMGLTKEQIIQVTGLSMEEIENL
ncbi:hypothetical protein OSSY52_03000 [Tepiditoga spiralis]|uniref:AAA-ATPase-like domain-containing protein n=1 Tax=Tepiditoga spiralis TaxID=2108365 RepID=A0A7G1G9Y5_9BACT|nr:AAA family ATPase [Tepiditoga spiralis]BBE30159.1 hypothetical protein OSSY52_03000 [Tepiditoga spiralis]